MISFVGRQDDFRDAMKSLIELEYDAVGAYEEAIQRLSNSEFKKVLSGFKADHERHIQELTPLLTQKGETAPQGPDKTKNYLAKGKVILGSLMGDKTILRAMNSNEIDTNGAYERMLLHEDIWENVIPKLKVFREDERRHKKWLEDTLSEL